MPLIRLQISSSVFWYLACSPLPGMLLCYIDISSHVGLRSIGPVWRVPWCELFFNYNIRMVTQYMICGWASIATDKVQRDVYPLVYHCNRIHCTHMIKYVIDFLLVLQVVKQPFKCIIYITYTCHYLYEMGMLNDIFKVSVFQIGPAKG